METQPIERFQQLAAEAAEHAPVRAAEPGPFPRTAPRDPRFQRNGGVRSGGTPLPALASALCMAVARNEWDRMRPLAMQVAAKLGGDRGERLLKALGAAGAAQLPKLKHWEEVTEHRQPWLPESVLVQIEQWTREIDAAEQLIEAGERVLPLLLVGETRCGKTSMASIIAQAREIPVYRMNIAKVTGGNLGDTPRAMQSAIEEVSTRPGLWLVDEIDAVAGKRSADHAADKELAMSVGHLLTRLEELPPSFPLVATTNHVKVIDPAVLGRFLVVEWPRWADLSAEERCAFIGSQGGDESVECCSYAAAVKSARAARVARILGGAS